MDVATATLASTFGAAGLTIAILLYIVRELWKDNRETRNQMRQDQAQMLPALTASIEALRAAREESIRARALAERERQ